MLNEPSPAHDLVTNFMRTVEIDSLQLRFEHMKRAVFSVQSSEKKFCLYSAPQHSVQKSF